MKLYELTSDYTALMQLIDSGEDIPADVLSDTLESIELGIKEKADGIACVVKSLNAEIKDFKEEESNLADRRKKKEKNVESLKQYLSKELQKVGIDEVETSRNRISFRSSESIEFDDENKFIEWCKVNRDDLLSYSQPKPDKTAIKIQLKEGVRIVGAHIQNNKNIQIK